MSTPLFSGSRIPLYGDFPFYGETPLIGLIDLVGQDTLMVNPDVIRTYQQIIFRLELQVLHYQAVLKQLVRSEEPIVELAAEPSSPLNTASVQFVNSILQSCISEQSILRAFEDEEV
jgi:hypothetical protein